MCQRGPHGTTNSVGRADSGAEARRPGPARPISPIRVVVRARPGAGARLAVPVGPPVIRGRESGESSRRLMSTPGGRALAVFLCVCILLSCVSSLVASPAIYDLVLAPGIQHLKNAETDFKALSHNPLNADAIAQAHDELAAAYSDFSQVNATIGLYSGLLTISPHYHTMLEGARALLPIAIEASRAGMIGCDMLSLVSSRLKDPLDASSPGLTTADMAVIDRMPLRSSPSSTRSSRGSIICPPR